MKKLAVGALLVAALALLAFAGNAASQQKNHLIVTQLSGANEVPPVDTQARGVAIVAPSSHSNTIFYALIVANIEGVTQAHIHCGADGVNGPVVAFLFGPEPEGVTTNGVLAAGTVTESEVIPRPDSPECPGGVADMDDLIAKILSGEAYVNVHTLENPPGEIRGQLD
jgi:hypothetical protein